MPFPPRPAMIALAAALALLTAGAVPAQTVSDVRFAPGSFGFWMRILVVCILVLFGVQAQSIRERFMKRKITAGSYLEILVRGLSFGALYWIL